MTICTSPKKKMTEIIKEIVNQIKVDNPYFYIVGGFPRDVLLKRAYNDIDMVVLTDNQEDIGTKIIKKTTGTYLKFLNISGKKKIKLEISPLKFSDIDKDLKSRDLTLNSIAYKVCSKTGEYKIYDPCGGVSDLSLKILRCYDKKNFLEDPIRMLRVFRFQAQLGFEIDSHTFMCISELKSLIRESAKELIYEELRKIFSSKCCAKAIRNMALSGLLGEIIPEFQASISFCHQDKFHKNETIFEHSLKVMKLCEERSLGLEFIVAALFHDISKPFVFDGKHYLNHEKDGAGKTLEILKELGFPYNFAKTVSKIIACHMIPLNSHKKIFEIRYNLGESFFASQVEFITADKIANDFFWKEKETYHNFKKNLELLYNFDKNSFFSRINEIVNGATLKSFGIKQSIGFKQILNYLKNYYFKYPQKLSHEVTKKLLEQNLYFVNNYDQFKFGNIETRRVKEFIDGHHIVGVLQGLQELEFKSGIFEFSYLSEGDFHKWKKERQKNSSLFY